MKLIKAFPFPIREVQTDNGTEWTTQLLVKDPKSKTLFEKALEEMDIIYHRIRVATPRHNGNVERQNRLDEQRFYSKMRMYCLKDGRKQLEKYNKKSNNISKSCLKYRSPNAVLADYLVGILYPSSNPSSSLTSTTSETSGKRSARIRNISTTARGILHPALM